MIPEDFIAKVEVAGSKPVSRSSGASGIDHPGSDVQLCLFADLRHRGQPQQAGV